MIVSIFFSDSTRERAFNLVAQAFSSINADDFAAYVGLPVNDAVQGWCFKILLIFWHKLGFCENWSIEFD